ncbi:alpha/beta fold hydrolase [Hahella sp. KA22]|uniref:alpha/beta hydrolase n=1 Tax=Hahella sp. KA22 TaxID=1628392 RepID=UPI000FDF241B|nr:alpha/beta hydrolase [Hahella sp. KA22]AZZ91701.1 alpha/beta hydrolase [Hahella sp. KA22]QAY55071.1 alpha/beta fold hydrolase [Hahella sp. KA22]
MDELTLQLPHLKLAALRWGEGQPNKILALHGWLDNAASFSFLGPKLATAGYEVVAVDLPGHGYSQHRPPGASYHLLDYLHEVDQALIALGWSRPILLGHSLGAVISSLYAAAAQDRIARLILVEALGPVAAIPDDVPINLSKALAKTRTKSCQKKVYYTIEKLVEDRRRGFGGLSAEASRILVERNIQPVKDGWVWRTDARLRWPSYLRFSEEQVNAYLRAILTPTLLVAGDKGFISLDSEKNTRIDALAAARKETLRGGHHLHMDGDVDGLAQIIDDFLR